MLEFYSHVRKDGSKTYLKSHLYSVAKAMKDKVLQTNLNINNIENHMEKIAYLIGISHDFGKYTIYFQDYILKGNESELSNHGVISSVFGFWLVKNYLEKNNVHEHNLLKYMSLIVFQLIKHHHGNLIDISKDVKIADKIDNLKKQIESIKQNESRINDHYKEFLHDFDISEFYKMFDNSGDEDYKTIVEFELARLEYFYSFSEIDEQLRFFYFALNQYLYSLLVSNDKIDASKTEKIERRHIPSDIVEHYKKDIFGLTRDFSEAAKNKQIEYITSLDELRESVYQNVLKKLEAVDLSKERIFTITSPTGSGKTLTAFAVALKIREKSLFKQKPRIIYALPFTSIIEQNHSIIEAILKKYIEDFKENESTYLLKHHYFVNTKYMEENKELPVENALILIENWESEIVVTTFIQLFYTLIGNTNKALKKFHNIANSIIILDEVQNIPLKYWKLVNIILKLMAKYFNTYTILLTATKPLIFREYESVELLENYKEFFACQKLNRTKLIQTEISSKEDLIKEIANHKTVKSILVILNTIATTIDIFNNIKEDNQFVDYKKIYLSTNITPFERKLRIQAIKSFIKRSIKVIVVTTQLIEAGVDIDMDVVFRDMAPIDSIIQSAGRANRNGNNHKGAGVFITNLKDDKRAQCLYIYDKIAIKEGTERIITTGKEFEETKYLKLINQYFEEMIKKKSQLDSQLISEAVQSFYFYDKKPDYKQRVPVSSFKLIEEMPNYVSLFVAISKRASLVWNKFKELPNDPIEKKNEFSKFKGEFYSFVINIPEKCIGACQRITDDLYFLSIESNLNESAYGRKTNIGIGYNRDLNQWFI
ncbi:MAG: CRISPR-associated helicase Cas3' [Desulfobacterales bacterium]|nr:CRISPR-associated helicase Cas3' [Desulfobacterales bacterium]